MSDSCQTCGSAAEFGYKTASGMEWYCETHRLSQNYADARLPKAEAKQTTKQLARPLHVLAPLINDEIKKANEAARRAGLPYYLAVGKLLLEAKAQTAHGEFMRWVVRNLHVKHRQATEYMAFAKHESGGDCQFERTDSLTQLLREARNKPPPEPAAAANRTDHIPRPIPGAESNRLIEERRKLNRVCLEIITLGYKALAAKLHPDKGGPPQAMTLLNQARDRLNGQFDKDLLKTPIPF